MRYTHALWFAISAGVVASASNRAPASQPERAEGRLWYSVAEDTLAAPDPSRRIESGRYRTVGLDRGKLADLLARAPLERTDAARNAEVLMELPWPDGSYKEFRIEGMSIGERGLPVWCPDLKTYLGRTIDGSAAVRFDWSPSGFHAMIASGEAVVFIGPYSPGETQNYIVYHGRDWRPGPERTEGAPTAIQAAPGPPPAVSPSPAPLSSASIEEIAIKRGSFASEYPYELTFWRDGTATLMTMGVLRHNTVDHTCRGRVTPQDFARLATFIQREGFFDLNETYRDPRIEDGEVVVTSAVVDRRRKVVQNLNQAGPPHLKAIEGAIHALGKNVAWD